MAEKRKVKPAENGEANTGIELRRIANLLGLLATKEEPQSNKIAILSAAGFTPTEIANLIGTTPNTVNVTLSQGKAAKKKSRGKKKWAQSMG